MGAFTREQQDILTAMVHIGLQSAQLHTVDLVRRLTIRVAALEGALMERGLVTEDELEAARQRTQTNADTLLALDPDHSAGIDAIRRLLSDEDSEARPT